METLYDRIKKIRIQFGWSQEELAKKVGYADKTAIAKIETGKVDLPQSKICAFASALNVSISYLLDGDALTSYWENEKHKSINYDNFIHRYLGYESPYTIDGKFVNMRLSEEMNTIYRVSAEEYEDFYNFTKERIDREFKYLLGKAQKISLDSNITPFVKESSPDYLSANAAHERTDIKFTKEDRQADEDMLD